MQSDNAHNENIAGFSNHSEEDQKQWFETMQKVFDSKSDDA